MYVTPLDYQKNSLKFYVGKGNNSRLIKEIMKRRWWWNSTDDKNTQDVFMIWLQLKDQTYYKKINVIEGEQTQVYQQKEHSKSHAETEKETQESVNCIMTDSVSSENASGTSKVIKNNEKENH